MICLILGLGDFLRWKLFLLYEVHKGQMTLAQLELKDNWIASHMEIISIINQQKKKSLIFLRQKNKKWKRVSNDSETVKVVRPIKLFHIGLSQILSSSSSSTTHIETYLSPNKGSFISSPCSLLTIDYFFLNILFLPTVEGQS